MLKTYVYKYPYFSLRENNNTYIQNFKKEPLKIQNKKKQTKKNYIKKRELMLQKHKKKFDKTLKNKN